QAEDGIRDLTVTGVQTCALPIFGQRDQFPYLAKRPQIGTLPHGRAEEHVVRRVLAAVVAADVAFAAEPTCIACTPMQVGLELHRSEERRVGKEGGYRGVARE